MTDQTQLLREALEAFDAFGEADDVPSLLALTQKMEAIRTALAQPAEGGEPLFILHCGQIDSSGEQDEWETEANGQQRVDDFCRLHPGKKIKLYPAPPASQVQAQQPSGPHLFEFWWEAHMPQATQAEAWAAWQAAHSSKGVGIEQQPKPQPITVDEVAERLAEFPLLRGIASVDIHELMFLIRMVEAHHGITSDKEA